MNVFEKVSQLRDDVQKANLRKSGKNAHLKYEYYELGDFMPFVINKMVLYKLCSNVSFGKLDDSAVLYIINIEAPDERMMFTSPMSTANLSNCHPVQNLGAVQTYIRRYLWTSALELTDGDAIEPTTGDKPPKQDKPHTAPPKHENAPTGTGKLSEAQVKRLYAIASGKGKSNDAVKLSIKDRYGVDSTNDLTKAQYDEFCKVLESLPDKQKEA